MKINVVKFSQIKRGEGENLEIKGSNFGRHGGHDDAVAQCKVHQLRWGF